MAPVISIPGNPNAELPLEYKLQSNYPHVVRALPHEPLERYVSGGFHPVALGDVFGDGRYTIRHKLGYGGYSTVWLARDEREDHWVAIKIKQSWVSTDQLEQDPDIKAFKVLEQHYTTSNPTTPRCYARLLDYFQHAGPNGTHTCLVSECLGPTLFNIMQIYNDWEVQEIMRPDTILRASRQLIAAIATTHEAGLVHGGDSAPFHLLMSAKIANLVAEDFWEMLGGDPATADYEEEEPRPSYLPKHLVSVASWGAWFDNPEEDIRLLDWGESFPAGEPRSATPIAQPDYLRSPETFFVGSLDYRHDLWRVGCVISAYGSCDSDADYINAQIITIGNLPSRWQTKWQEMIKSKGKPLRETSIYKPLEEIFEPRRDTLIAFAEKFEGYEKPEFVEEDYQGLRCLLHVIRGLMQHDPEKRISAQEAASCIQWVDHWREPQSSDDEASDKAE